MSVNLSIPEKLDKLSLRECYLHSRLFEVVKVYNFEIVIRPWVAIQLEELQPVLVKIVKEISAFYQAKKDGKTEEILPAILKVIEQPKMLSDLMHLVYVTISHCNPEIVVDGTRYAIFDEAEMKQYLTLAEVISIARAALRINVEKNLSTGSPLPESQEPVAPPMILSGSPAAQ